MKSFTKKAFFVALLVMSFAAVPAVLAGTGPGHYNGPGDEPGPPDRDVVVYTVVVEGFAVWVSTVDGVIIVEDCEGYLTTVHGLPLWLNIKVGDYVVINCRISPDGKYVASYLTINNGPVIVLR